MIQRDFIIWVSIDQDQLIIKVNVFGGEVELGLSINNDLDVETL